MVLGFCFVAYAYVSRNPEGGVALALVPSLFLTEDLHQNYWAFPEDRLWTFHSMKLVGPLRPTEIVMLVLLFSLVVRYWNRWHLLRSPLNRPVLVLLVLCPLFGLLSILRGSDPTFALAYNAWRSFWWAVVFYFFCLHALQPSRIEYYFRVFFFAILLRMVMGAVAFTVGYGDVHLLYEDTAIVFWDGLDLHLASSLFLISLAMLLGKQDWLSRGWSHFGLGISAFVILLSLRRGPVGNVVFGFLLLFLWLPLERRARILKGFALLVVVGALVLGIADGFGEAPSVEFALERASQVFEPNVASAHTFHLFDPLDHLVAILKDPILGIGFGTPIQRTFLITEEEATFSHNAYLGVWGGMGIVGLIAYLALYYRTLRLGREVFISSGKAMLVAGLVGVILSALVQGIYSTGPFTSSRMPFVLFFSTALLVKYQERLCDREAGKLATAKVS